MSKRVDPRPTHIWITAADVLARVSQLGPRLGLPHGTVQGILVLAEHTLDDSSPSDDVVHSPSGDPEAAAPICAHDGPTSVYVRTLGPLVIQVHGRVVAEQQWKQSGAGANNIRKLFAFLLHTRNRWLIPVDNNHGIQRAHRIRHDDSQLQLFTKEGHATIRQRDLRESGRPPVRRG